MSFFGLVFSALSPSKDLSLNKAILTLPNALEHFVVATDYNFALMNSLLIFGLQNLRLIVFLKRFMTIHGLRW